MATTEADVLDTFLDRNPQLDLKAANLFDADVLGRLDWGDADRAQTLSLLKQRQRLGRIVDNSDHASALAGRGLTSAQHVAALPAHEFVAEYGDLFANPAQARDVHAKARNVRNQVMNLLANVHGLVASPWFRGSRFFDVNDDVVEFFESLPSYGDFFGGLDYCRCEHCRSILGPAAYFVDIMRITDKYITLPNTKPVRTIPPSYALKERRPDLFKIPLTCANTVELQTYLSIVNDVLQANITADGQISNVYQTLALAKYPVNLPFNLPLTEIRQYLSALKTTLVDVDRRFLPPSTAGTAKAGGRNTIDLAANASSQGGAYVGQEIRITAGAGRGQSRIVGAYDGASKRATVEVDWHTPPDSTSQYVLIEALALAREALGLSPEEMRDLITPAPDQATVGAYYGYDDLPKHLQLFAAKTGTLAFAKGKSDVTGNGTSFTTELMPGARLLADGQFRTVVKISSATSLTVDEPWLRDASAASYQAIVFQPGTGTISVVKDQNKVVGSGVDFTATLRPGDQIQAGADVRTVRTIKNATELSTTAAWSFSQTALSYSVSRADVLNHARVLIERLGYIYQQLTALLVQSLDGAELLQNRADSFYINATGEALPSMRTASDHADPYTPYVGVDGLSVARLDRIRRFARLATALAWLPADLQTAMDALPPAHSGATTVSITAGQVAVTGATGTDFGATLLPGMMICIGGENRVVASVQTTTLTVTQSWSQTLADVPYRYGARDIDRSLLRYLAQVAQLKSSLDLSVAELCALWSEMTTTGRIDGAAPKDLFDRVFNDPALLDGKNPYTSPVAIPFDPARPLTWTVDDRTGDNAEIRSRLIGALMISDNELTSLAHYLLALMGTPTATTLRLTLLALSRLYRFAKLAQTLGVTIDEFLTYLWLVSYPDGELARPPAYLLDWSPEWVAGFAADVAWLKNSPFTVYELKYIVTGQASSQFPAPFTADSVRMLIGNISALSENARVTPSSFTSESITAEQSAQIYAMLAKKSYITDIGVLLPAEMPFAKVAPDYPLTETSFETANIGVAESKEVFRALTSRRPPIIVSELGATSGYLDALIYTENVQLDFLFVDQVNADEKREEVRAVLDATLRLIADTVFAFLFPLNDESFVTRDIDAATSAGVFAQLMSHVPPYLVSAPLGTGLLTTKFTTETSLDFLFVSTGAGQSGAISSYAGATRTATLGQPWTTEPLAGSLYRISKTANTGTVRSAAIATVQLAESASPDDGAYAGMMIEVTSAAGVQTRMIDGYVGATRTASVDLDWDRVPDDHSTYRVAQVATSGAARGGSTTTIILDEAASPDDSTYNGMDVEILPVPDAQRKRGEVFAVLMQTKTDIARSADFLLRTLSLQNATARGGIAGFLGTSGPTLDAMLDFALALLGITDFLKLFLTPLGPGPAPKQAMTLIAALSRLLLLINGLRFTADEIRTIIYNAANFNISAIGQPRVSDVQALSVFGIIAERYSDRIGPLLAYLSLSPDGIGPTGRAKALAEVTGWPSAQIVQLANALWPADAGLLADGYQSVLGIARLQASFDLGALIGVDVSFLLDLAALATLSLVDGSGNLDPAAWAKYEARRQALLGAYRARFTNEEFATSYGNTLDVIDTMKRDVLVPFDVWRLNRTHPEINNADGLYQYLLIDVEMSSCDQISPIAQAIGSVQLYMQRVRMNLEPGADRVLIPTEWWLWLSAYRVWEANRMVFLYPENYIDPALRPHASSIYQKMVEDLQQINIDQASVEDVFLNYFSEFDTLANLVNCASFHGDVVDHRSEAKKRVLFIIGRTRAKPYTYYHRVFDPETAWSPWMKIDLSINAEYITPIYAFDRLMVFWSELTTRQGSKVSGGNASPQQVITATVKYSFKRTNDTWVQPQVLAEDIVTNVAPDLYPPVPNSNPQVRNPYVTTILAENNLYFYQPYVLRIDRGVTGLGTITITPGLGDTRGVKTDFTHQVREGDRIWCSGEEREVAVRISDDTVFVDPAWSKTASTAKYRIIPRNTEEQTLPTFAGSGTVTVQGTNVGGAGTKFQQQMLLGDRIMVGSEVRTVIIIQGDTLLTVDQAFTQPYTGVAYQVIPTSEIPERLIVFFGPRADVPTAAGVPVQAPTEPDPQDTDPYNRSKYRLDESIFQTVMLSQQGSLFGTSKGDTSVSPLMLVHANLSTSDLRLLLPTYEVSQTAAPQPIRPVLDRVQAKLSVAAGNSAIRENYWGNYAAGRIDPPPPTSTPTGLLDHVASNYASVTNVANQPGWFIFDNGDEQFLVTPDGAELTTLSEASMVQPLIVPLITKPVALISAGSYLRGSAGNGQYRFDRLSTSTVTQLTQTLFAQGIDGLLTVKSQLTPELPFDRFYPNRKDKPANVIAPSPVLDFKGAFGLYFWEVFFFAPFLVGNQLNLNQRFSEAKTWYEYIFNPTISPDDTEGRSLDRYWRFLPFRNITLQSLTEILTDPVQIAVYQNHPLDPDAIALLRPGTYPKALMMKYIDNLLDWGDFLFRQDTRESINQATNLYVMASELLGPRPVEVGDCASGPPVTFQDLLDLYGDNIPPFLIELENTPMIASATLVPNLSDTPVNDVHAYFCVPENSNLTAYWDRVEDRLFKIRHCMNIEGVVRQLALFAPPLDVRQLIAGLAVGGGLLNTSHLAPAVPPHRFATMVAQAKSLTGTLTQLGSSLLSALERKDSEQLQRLSITQEQVILNMTTAINEARITELDATGLALADSRAAAQARFDYYDGLVKNGLNAGEVLEIVASLAGTVFDTLASVTRAASSIGYALPQVGSPFAMTYGGKQLGAVLTAASGVFEIGSAISHSASQRALTVAGYERRADEWTFQRGQAEIDIKAIDNQIQANLIQKQIAERQLQVHLKQIEQNKQTETFLTGKFTNEQLYSWMAGRLSTLHFQTYQLAIDLALSAQTAFQYDLDTNQRFINFGYWDSLRKGLLAGEGLMLSLNQMEKTYIERDGRALSIEKSISLVRLDPKALLDLKRNGSCTFAFPEKLFDYDHPGFYARKIRSVSVSIPALVGPYQTLNATLTQQSNQIALKPKVDTVRYLLGDNTATIPPPDELRSNWWVNQQVVLSTGENDSGMFQGEPNDERYLPFEGTGAVSTWRLSLPKQTNHIDFEAISDVIINLRYTALNGGAALRDLVVRLDALKPYPWSVYLDLRQRYSQAWQSFMTSESVGGKQTLKIGFGPDLAPLHVDRKRLTAVYLQAVSPFSTAGSAPYIDFTVAPNVVLPLNPKTDNAAAYDFVAEHKPQPRFESILGERDIVFDLGKTPSSLKTDGKLAPDKLLDLRLVLFFDGEIAW